MKKFINWLNFNPPFALSAAEWSAFKKEFRKSAPVRYFLTEVIYKKSRSYILNGIQRIQIRIINFIDPPNIIRIPISNSNEYRGHDLILNSAFTVLVNYIEIDLGVLGTDYEKRPWKNRWLHFLNYSYRLGKRFPAAGIQYLTEECQYSPERAECYNDAITLYLWWTITRKTRKLPEYPFAGQQIVDFDRNSKEYKAIKEHSKLINQLYQQWLDEDNLMLSKLVLIMKDLH